MTIWYGLEITTTTKNINVLPDSAENYYNREKFSDDEAMS